MARRTTAAMSAIFRFGTIAFASALLLSPAIHAAPQQPAGTQGQAQPSDHQDDQSGPPTLRHKDDQSPAPGNAAPNPSKGPAQPASQPGAPVTPPPDNAPPLTEQSKLQLLRYVDGEFAKVLTPLPGGTDG